jgi:hypothetical protein
VLWKTQSLIMRDVSVDFLFTLCTYLPLYSGGLWEYVTVHSKDCTRKFSYRETLLCYLMLRGLLQ